VRAGGGAGRTLGAGALAARTTGAAGSCVGARCSATSAGRTGGAGATGAGMTPDTGSSRGATRTCGVVLDGALATGSDAAAASGVPLGRGVAARPAPVGSSFAGVMAGDGATGATCASGAFVGASEGRGALVAAGAFETAGGFDTAALAASGAPAADAPDSASSPPNASHEMPASNNTPAAAAAGNPPRERAVRCAGAGAEPRSVAMPGNDAAVPSGLAAAATGGS